MNDKEALERLMTMFFMTWPDNHLEWLYNDGITVHDIDPELENYLMEKYGDCFRD